MKNTDRLFGSLELLVLKTLAAGPNHGFGITVHVETVSKGLQHMKKARCTRRCTAWSESG